MQYNFGAGSFFVVPSGDIQIARFPCPSEAREECAGGPLRFGAGHGRDNFFLVENESPARETPAVSEGSGTSA